MSTKSKLPSLWRNRDYMLLWSGQIVSTLGSTASAVVYPLLILAISNSPSAAGIASALTSLPYLIFSLPVGALIDRWDRKKVMVICDFGRAALLASVALSLWFQVLTIWQIYICAFIEGSFFVFFNLAEVAALTRVVPKAQLPEASAQNEAASGAAGIAGPSLGTFLYQTFGKMAPFAVDACSYFLSAISLLFIRTSFQEARGKDLKKLNLRADISEGLKWLWGQRLVRMMAFLTGGTNLVFASTPLIIIMLAKSLGAEDAQVGLVFSISGIGGIIGSLMGGAIQKRFSFGQVINAVMWAQAILFSLFFIAPNFVWIGVIAASIFMVSPIYNVVQFSYRISIIPDSLQGRVNSTFRLIAFGLNPVGAALSGFLLENYGVKTTILCLFSWYLLLAICTSLSKEIRHANAAA